MQTAGNHSDLLVIKVIAMRLSVIIQSVRNTYFCLVGSPTFPRPVTMGFYMFLHVHPINSNFRHFETNKKKSFKNLEI